MDPIRIIPPRELPTKEQDPVRDRAANLIKKLQENMDAEIKKNTEFEENRANMDKIKKDRTQQPPKPEGE